jgi:crotonobetainyl-CoA:carnitine CoA-transferase CaiB-like acyl-CoA transferase
MAMTGTRVDADHPAVSSGGDTASAPRGALHGLVVLDLTMMLAGPFATMMLADQGARVIKIEPPGGDPTRGTGPHPPGARAYGDGGFGAYFASTNRNKESLVLDLKQQAGRDTLLQMVRGADVLVENYRAGVMERLGLGWETLHAINPRLVYGTLRGFGDRRSGESPYVDWPAYDPVAQAMGGIMGITGIVPGGPPTKVGPGVGDIIPAMFLSYGIISACWRARSTGQGQFVDVGMVDAVLAVCERLVFQYSATGTVPRPEGNGHPLIAPFGMFPAKDGFVSLGIPRDEFWQVFTRLAGMPQHGEDPRFRTSAQRVAHRELIDRIVGDWTSVRTKAEIAQVLGGHVPFGPVFGADDIFADPHFRARNMLAQVEQPGADRPLTVANTPVHMSGTPGGVRRRAPLVGEHTDTVLADFGFDAQQLRSLRDAGVIA